MASLFICVFTYLIFFEFGALMLYHASSILIFPRTYESENLLNRPILLSCIWSSSAYYSARLSGMIAWFPKRHHFFQFGSFPVNFDVGKEQLHTLGLSRHSAERKLLLTG